MTPEQQGRFVSMGCFLAACVVIVCGVVCAVLLTIGVAKWIL